MWDESFFAGIVQELILTGIVIGVVAIGVAYGLYQLCTHITISWN